ncbi:MAG TPA: SRPBCC family protein [Mycobacteriales bacterium]|nr:SRPBCC family protein [Mycobacteriales bacterium]
MPRVASSIVIDRPVAEVFAYLGDWTHATEFTESLVSWRPLSDVKDAVGAQFAAAMRIGPTTQKSTVEIVRREAGAEIAWESRAGFQQRGSYRFEPAGSGTRVDFVMEVTLPGGPAGRLLGRIVEPFARDNTAKTLDNLKRILER